MADAAGRVESSFDSGSDGELAGGVQDSSSSFSLSHSEACWSRSKTCHASFPSTQRAAYSSSVTHRSTRTCSNDARQLENGESGKEGSRRTLYVAVSIDSSVPVRILCTCRISTTSASLLCCPYWSILNINPALPIHESPIWRAVCGEVEDGEAGLASRSATTEEGVREGKRHSAWRFVRGEEKGVVTSGRGEVRMYV